MNGNSPTRCVAARIWRRTVTSALWTGAFSSRSATSEPGGRTAARCCRAVVLPAPDSPTSRTVPRVPASSRPRTSSSSADAAPLMGETIRGRTGARWGAIMAVLFEASGGCVPCQNVPKRKSRQGNFLDVGANIRDKCGCRLRPKLVGRFVLRRRAMATDPPPGTPVASRGQRRLFRVLLAAFLLLALANLVVWLVPDRDERSAPEGTPPSSRVVFRRIHPAETDVGCAHVGEPDSCGQVGRLVRVATVRLAANGKGRVSEAAAS